MMSPSRCSHDLSLRVPYNCSKLANPSSYFTTASTFVFYQGEARVKWIDFPLKIDWFEEFCWRNL